MALFPVISQVQFTGAEVAFLQGLAGLAYVQGDILYYNNTALTRLGIGTAGQVLTVNGGATAPSWATSGAGDVVGPASSTDNALVLFDGATGKLLKNSTIINAAGALTGVVTVNGFYPAYSGADTVVASANAEYTSPVTALAATPASGYSYYVSDGTYTLTSAIQITRSSTKLNLSGGAVIQNNGNTLTTLINTSTTGFSRVEISGGKLLQTNATAQGVAIDLSDTPNSWISRMRIEEYGTGIQIIDAASTSFYSSFRDIQMFNVNNGISLGGTQPNLNLWENVRIRTKAGSAGTAVNLVDTRGNVFIMVDAEPGTAAGLTGFHLDATTRDNLFLGVWIENNATGLLIDAGANNNVFIGGSITSNTVTDISDAGTNTVYWGVNKTGTKLYRVPMLTDVNGLEVLKFTEVAVAVNEFTISNNSTGANPILSATGETNVGLNFQIKGTGTYRFLGTATAAAEIRLYEDTDDGSNYSAFKVGTQAADITYTLPTAVGGAGTYLSDAAGNGVLSWAAAVTPTTITVANEATDATSFIAFFTAASGDLGPKTNVNMTFNASTGVATFASTVLTTTDINGGTLDGVTVGGASAAAATVTTLGAGAITSTGLLTVTVAGNTARFVNSSDATPVQAIRIEGDRATMADGDEAYASLMLSDDGGTQAEFARIRWVATDVNVGTSLDGALKFSVVVAGTMTGILDVRSGAVSPTTSDGAALGTTGLQWSDLFMASGAVINIANGNWVATHTSAILTVTTGDLRVTSANVGTNGDSVPTLSSTSTLTNKTLTSPTLTTPSAFTTGGNITLAENTAIALDPAGSADGKYTGITITGTAGTTLAFGDLIYLAVADSRWELTDADAVATAGNIMIGMCVLAAAADGSATTILLKGIIRADAKFPALTVGAAVYVGETAGAVQVAIPTGADNVIRVVGFAMTADELYFSPSQDHQTTVA